jgi:hypothetical protein
MTADLFRMGDLATTLSDPFKMDLPPLKDRFSLPSLDEMAAGSERLLEGLESMRLVPTATTRKGKEKEVKPVAVDTVRELDLWERVATGQAGPSRPTFQAS